MEIATSNLVPADHSASRSVIWMTNHLWKGRDHHVVFNFGVSVLSPESIKHFKFLVRRLVTSINA